MKYVLAQWLVRDQMVRRVITNPCRSVKIPRLEIRYFKWYVLKRIIVPSKVRYIILYVTKKYPKISLATPICSLCAHCVHDVSFLVIIVTLVRTCIFLIQSRFRFE